MHRMKKSLSHNWTIFSYRRENCLNCPDKRKDLFSIPNTFCVTLPILHAPDVVKLLEKKLFRKQFSTWLAIFPICILNFSVPATTRLMCQVPQVKGTFEKLVFSRSIYLFALLHIDFLYSWTLSFCFKRSQFCPAVTFLVIMLLFCIVCMCSQRKLLSQSLDNSLEMLLLCWKRKLEKQVRSIGTL